MLRHYGFYLDEAVPDELALIKVLEPFVQKRRVGQVARSALLNHFQLAQQSSPALFQQPSIRAAVVGLPNPVQAAIVSGSQGAIPAPNNDILQKAKSAFLKR